MDTVKSLPTFLNFKAVIRCYMHFYKLFELKHVLAVCVHKYPIMIKNHPVFFKSR